LAVRAGTPKAVTDKLFAAAAHALRQPQVAALIATQEFEIPADISAQSVERKLAEDARAFVDTARRLGIRPM
jgi:tripartite-type tricarboxylate transporter receptor subunit TctC